MKPTASVWELSPIQGLEKVGSEVTNAFGAQQLQGAGEGIVIFSNFRVETVRQKKRVSSRVEQLSSVKACRDKCGLVPRCPKVPPATMLD